MRTVVGGKRARLGIRWAAIPWFLAFLGGCGRSGIAVPFEACTEATGSNRGCSFRVASPLHLVDALGEVAAVPPEQRLRDGLIVVNPDEDRSARVQLSVSDGDGPTWVVEDLVVGPLGSHALRLPDLAGVGSAGTEGEGVAVLASAHPVAAFLLGPEEPFVGNDATLLLPDATLGTRYVVPGYPPHLAQHQGIGAPSYFQVTGGNAAVDIRWRAPVLSAVLGGETPTSIPAHEWSAWTQVPAGVLLRVAAPDGDLSGTVIEASAPVWAMGGTRCAAVPASASPQAGCDPLFEQLTPVESWGRRVIVPPPPRPGGLQHVRIYAGAEEVSVSIRGPLGSERQVLQGVGDFADLRLDVVGVAVVEADGPILAVAYLETRAPEPQVGDPAMVQLVPDQGWSDRYVVHAPSNWAHNLLQVVAADGTRVELDGAELDAGTPTGLGVWATILEVSPGVHVLEGSQRFGLYQFGWTNELRPSCRAYSTHGTCQTSYANAAGRRFTGGIGG